MPRKDWADWAVFAPVARQFVTEFIAAHPKHRPPKQRELTTPSQRSFYNACKKHGGLRTTLVRLGFKPSRREDKPTRRSDWNQFSVDIRPIIASYLERNGRLPTQKQLREGGHVWIDRGIVIHHGGYEAVYRKLGYERSNDKPLSHWPTFVSKFEPVIRQLTEQLGRTPTYHDMLATGHKTLVDATYRTHGGYRAALVKLGFTPARQGKPRGTGLANWEAFSQAFRPHVLKFVETHGHPPSLTDLERLQLRHFYYAARNHHGGYLATLRRLGFEPTEQQAVKPRQGWRNRNRQRSTLERHFPELLQLGIMPSCTMVKRRIPGLCAYWTWRRYQWATIATTLGLTPYAIGRPLLDRFNAMTEALAFFRKHRRWPQPAEMSRQLRRQWVGGETWETFFTPNGFLPTIQLRLQEILKDHWRWSERFHPESAPWSLRLYNQVVLSYNAATQSPTPATE